MFGERDWGELMGQHISRFAAMPPEATERSRWMHDLTQFSLERDVRNWKIRFALWLPLMALIGFLAGALAAWWGL